ncbi:MAG: two-component system, OmpR family, operon response regulator KdpE, partial [Miltoncostaeaceae bacterium]|nr:two-component system, OmpR family, operon response regulator KdpE [Miltoncostaeaceae bacterium]
MSARILVVEDEPQILRALSALLRTAGYGAEGAGTVADAVQAALLRPPDAVLLDLLLPDGNGLELCRRLREWSHVPIVVVSAVGDEREKIAALDAGADDYVTKPYAPGELLARLRAVMRRAAA